MHRIPKRLSRRTNSRRASIWLIIVIVMAITGAIGVGWWQFSGSKFRRDDNLPMLHTVESGPFDHVVLEQGEIESSSNVEIKSKVKSRGASGTPIIWVIDEGAYAKQGDELVRLDSSAYEQEFKQQRIVLNSAEASVIASDAALKKAIIAREEYLEGTYLNERTAILSEIALAQQEMRKAELSLASAERLAAKGTLKSLQIEAEQFAVQNARNKLEAAEGKLRVLDELTKAKMLVQYDSDIEAARAKLESDQSSLAEEKNKLKEIEAQIEACTIRSPAEGQVVYANKFSSRGGSEFVVEPGAMVREQQTVIVIPDPNKMQVKAKINESKITLINEGMPTKIRVSASQGDLLGRVEKVNKYAEPGSWFSSAVKEYATFIRIIDPPPTIRTGMTAEVRIFVEQIPDAIQVPVHAIYELKGHHFALIRSGSSWETRELKIGATNEKFVTIKDGLTVGDQVVLNPREHLTLMKLPEIEEVSDREKLAEIAASAPPPSQSRGRGEFADAPNGGAAGGRPSGGAGGPGGAGMDPAAIASMSIQRLDTDSDGKISKDEASQDERMSGRFSEVDTNNDGFIDAGEMAASLRKMMQQMGGGFQGGRGQGGPASNP